MMYFPYDMLFLLTFSRMEIRQLMDIEGVVDANGSLSCRHTFSMKTENFSTIDHVAEIIR